MANRQWNPAKRLRHLEAVSARNVTLGCSGEQPQAYFSLSLWTDKDSRCCPLYRSEGVCDTLNPEWMPLSWPLDLEPACQAQQVVLAIHQATASAAGQGDRELATARMFSQPWPGNTSSKGEGTGNGSSSPALLAPPASEACVWQSTCQDANSAEQLSSSMTREPADEGQHAAAAKHQTDLQSEDDLAVAVAAASELCWSSQHGNQEALAQLDEQQDSNGFTFDVAPEEGQYSPNRSEQADRAQGPTSENQLMEAKGKATSQQLKVIAATPKESFSGEQGAAAASAVVGAAKALAASRPDAFPGEVVTAWLLDLNRLYFVGNDLASLKEALAPNTVVLQLEGGLFVHPPPPEDAAAISLSQTASPTKRALTLPASERLPTSSPTGSAPRRFANLLMSKLLRSTPSLQDTAERGAVESDSDHDDAASEASASTRYTSHTVAREAAGMLLGGNPAPIASVGPTKALALLDMSLHITALCALRSSVLDLHSRAQALRGRLEELVAVRQQAKEQEQQLWQVQQDAQRSRQRMQRLQHRLGELHQELGGAKKAATVRTQALVTTLKVMKAADREYPCCSELPAPASSMSHLSRKLQDAQESMRGEEGQGRLVGLHSELVARRCRMTCQLGGIFQLGPVTVSVLEAPPGGYLEDRLEQQWVGRGGNQGQQEAPALKLLLPPDFRGWPANGTAALEAESAVHLRQEVHLSIGGIELRSAVWRAAFEYSAGMDITAAEDEAAAVALGYVAQLVDRLADYLGVQLRYPLCLLGSKSSILEGYPPAGTWSAEEPVKRTLFGRSDPSASSSTGTASGEGSSIEPAEYPLHCQNRRERPKFAVGVFLLNKNITQLLQAHGITAGGPNHLLHNLYKLLCAANSGLPQRQQRQQKRG